MKFASFLLLLVVFTISSEAQPFSPYDWATYYAVKKTHDLKIDGDLEDWKKIKGFSLDQEKYFFVGQGMSSSKWNGVTDLSGNFKVQWDESYIYIAIEAADDKVTPPMDLLQKTIQPDHGMMMELKSCLTTTVVAGPGIT